MPYEMRKLGDQYCVYNKDTGEKKGCSDTRAMAVKHMRALYAAESGSSKTLDELDSYDTQLLLDNPDLCLCEKCTTIPEGLDAVWVSNDDHKSLIQELKDFVVGLVPQTQSQWLSNQVLVQNPNLVTLTKDDSGATRVLMRVSNVFKDRHGEIITTEAHKDYVDWVNEAPDKRMPEFWLWHIKGSRWGRADLVYFEDGFLTTSGLVDAGMEYVPEALNQMSKDLGVSHGFYGFSAAKGFIDKYRSFEVSPLPSKHAANVWTAFMLAKEAAMGLTKDHRTFLTQVGVPELIIEEWDKTNKDFSALLKENGIEYKSDDSSSASSSTTPANQASGTTTPEPTLADVLTAVNQLQATVVGIEAKQKEFETKLQDPVAAVLQAAITPGAVTGQSATKSADNAPNPDELKKHDDWATRGFADLFVGGGK